MASATITDQISYTDLYARWERGNWRSTELDFSRDRIDWRERLTDTQRRAALWNYSLFFHGEDSVAHNLSPYIDAAPLEEQKYFLATQQVDEARHAVFFARFMREVVDRGETVRGSLEATHPELTWGFRKVFGLLDEVADRLRRDRSRPMLAAAVTMYHIVVEASLAQPGQHFIDSYLEDRELLPGFREGMRNVSLDEQRHIGFGVKLLHDLQREDPECRYAVADMLREALPYTASVFVPPNWDRRYVECFGMTLEDLFNHGFHSLETKMRSAGMPLDELPGPAVVPLDLSDKERTERVLTLLESNVLGEKLAPPSSDPKVMAMLFDLIERAVDTSRSPARPLTIQWDFKDAAPWHLRINNGSTSAAEGRVPDADLTLRSRYEDWVDIIAGRQDPRRAILRGRLRPKGNPLNLWRIQKLFVR